MNSLISVTGNVDFLFFSFLQTVIIIYIWTKFQLVLYSSSHLETLKNFEISKILQIY